MAFKGGRNMTQYLLGVANRLSNQGVVRVGFLENATYPIGAKGKTKKTLHVAQVAFWNNFGTSRAIARPFFTNMIEDQSKTWGRKIETAAKLTNYDSRKMLTLLGTDIKDHLVKAIVDWPADNAPSTVAKKGFNKGLIDTAVMSRSVDFEVDVK